MGKCWPENPIFRGKNHGFQLRYVKMPPSNPMNCFSLPYVLWTNCSCFTYLRWDDAVSDQSLIWANSADSDAARALGWNRGSKVWIVGLWSGWEVGWENQPPFNGVSDIQQQCKLHILFDCLTKCGCDHWTITTSHESFPVLTRYDHRFVLCSSWHKSTWCGNPPKTNPQYTMNGGLESSPNDRFIELLLLGLPH